MKRLIMFELRKIMVRRVWIAMAACLAVTIFFFVDTAPAPGMNSIMAVKKERPDLIAAHEGPIESALAKKYAPSLDMERAEDTKGSKEEKLERILQQNYAVAAYQSNLFNDRLKDLSKQKAELESQSETESYAYKNISKKLSMMERIDPPGFYVTMNWRDLFSFISDLSSPSILFIGLVMVLALAPLYSGEASYRMDSLILSSRFGRRSIVVAKLSAGFIFTVGWITAFYGICVIVSCMPNGFVGWNAPLSSYFRESPYALTMLQAFFLQYALALMGACGLLLWIALISAAFRSSLSSFGLAMTLVILPFISLPGVIGKIIPLLPTSIIASSAMIKSYKSYNFFHTPILYLPLSIVVTVILGIVILLLIPKTFERRLKV